MILHRRTFQCHDYQFDPNEPGGALIFRTPVQGFGAVYIPNLKAGLPGFISAIRVAQGGSVGTLAGEITFVMMGKSQNRQLRILSGDWTVFLAEHMAEQLLQDLELMQ